MKRRYFIILYIISLIVSVIHIGIEIFMKLEVSRPLETSQIIFIFFGLMMIFLLMSALSCLKSSSLIR